MLRAGEMVFPRKDRAPHWLSNKHTHQEHYADGAGYTYVFRCNSNGRGYEIEKEQ